MNFLESTFFSVHVSYLSLQYPLTTHLVTHFLLPSNLERIPASPSNLLQFSLQKSLHLASRSAYSASRWLESFFHLVGHSNLLMAQARKLTHSSTLQSEAVKHNETHIFFEARPPRSHWKSRKRFDKVNVQRLGNTGKPVKGCVWHDKQIKTAQTQDRQPYNMKICRLERIDVETWNNLWWWTWKMRLKAGNQILKALDLTGILRHSWFPPKGGLQ